MSVAAARINHSLTPSVSVEQRTRWHANSSQKATSRNFMATERSEGGSLSLRFSGTALTREHADRGWWPMTRRDAIEQAARQARIAAIRSCGGCDPSGWLLGPDRTPIEPAVRCDRAAPAKPPAVRDITQPVHQPNRTEESQQ